jgi:RNA polymerase sigma-70 factor (ECF subfamily)
MTDQQLIDRARGGDEEAFQTLYQCYRDPLFRFAYRLTSSAEEAEDLVHDCFVGVFRAGFDECRGTLRTYLYAAVRNLARKHFRDTGREDRTDEFEISTADDPLDGLLAREIAEEVKSAVARLPLLQREVLVLAEYEELSLEEIANIVEADVGAVKSRLHRARTGLRKLLVASMKGSA